MYHAGLGQRHVSNFMAALEIPSLHHKSMKAREREIAPSMKKVAEESCKKALQEEIDLTLRRTRWVVLGVFFFTSNHILETYASNLYHSFTIL